MAVHSNIGGGQHVYLGLVVVLNAYALLTNTPFVRQVHPGNLSIPIAATRHAQEEMKQQYNENLQAFHKIRGAERALVQQLLFAVEENISQLLETGPLENSQTPSSCSSTFLLLRTGKSIQDN